VLGSAPAFRSCPRLNPVHQLRRATLARAGIARRDSCSTPLPPAGTRSLRCASVILTSPPLLEAEVRITTAPLRRERFRGEVPGKGTGAALRGATRMQACAGAVETGQVRCPWLGLARRVLGRACGASVRSVWAERSVSMRVLMPIRRNCWWAQGLGAAVRRRRLRSSPVVGTVSAMGLSRGAATSSPVHRCTGLARGRRSANSPTAHEPP